MILKRFILTADDYAMSRIYDAEILKLISSGIISSVSVMVSRVTLNEHSTLEKLSVLANYYDVSLGLHYEAKEGDDHIAKLDQQHENFKIFLNRDPDYFDIHAPHKLQNDLDDVWDLLNMQQKPVRNMGQKNPMIRTLDGEALIATKLNEDYIRNWIANLQPGFYEIVFHPGTFDPSCKSTLNGERMNDIYLAKKIKVYIDGQKEWAICNYKMLDTKDSSK